MSKQLNENSPHNPNMFINWIGKIGEIREKYGFFGVLLNLILLLLCVVTIYITFNPNIIFNKINELTSKAHTAAIEFRMKNETDIRLTLKDLVYDSGADRGFVIELHNGTNNPSGLPFLFGSLTYEEIRNPELNHIDSEYKSMPLSSYPFLSEVYKEIMWTGSTAELCLIDKKLGYKMMGNNAEYLCLVLIEGKNQPIGFVGITYTKEPNMTDGQMQKIVSRFAQKFGLYLDASNIKK